MRKVPIRIHERIHRRHPELSAADVLTNYGRCNVKYVTQGGDVLTDQDIEEIAERLERGELPGKWGRILVGRPRISSEQLKLIGVKVPVSKVQAFDEKAARNGQTRSQRLRQLIERDLEEDSA